MQIGFANAKYAKICTLHFADGIHEVPCAVTVTVTVTQARVIPLLEYHFALTAPPRPLGSRGGGGPSPAAGIQGTGP